MTRSEGARRAGVPHRALAVAMALLLGATPLAAAPVRVQFRFQHPNASSVSLAGTFNDWDTDADPMSGPDVDGWWTIEKLLDPDIYEYKFVANGGDWYTDPLNPRFDPEDFNNSILEVSDPLVYYLLPKSGALIGDPTPVITADLAKSDGAAFDLGTLEIAVDGASHEGAPYFDQLTSRVTFPVGSPLANGTHEAAVRVALEGGSADADSTIFEIEADLVPPVIDHTPPESVPAHESVVVSCVITDDVGVRSAALSYRSEGQPGFSVSPMYGGLDDIWTGTIPAGVTEAGHDLEYFIEASDLTNTSRSPESGVYDVPVVSDTHAPSVSEAFVSPTSFSPDAQRNRSRLSFWISEPCTVTVEVTTAGGALRRTLIASKLYGAGYHDATWNGRTDAGVAVADGGYLFHVNAVDEAGLPAPEAVIPVTVDRGAQDPPLNVVVLFHANQTVNYQGDTANDVCFNGLLRVLRRHPQSKFMLHFSGSLLHDLGWFNFRHDPSTLDMLRAGAADGQFEIVGSTYAQNIPYSTDMWDNDRQVEAQREVIETMVGASPVSFWNPERCWTQALVPLIAGNGYTSTWVETHILNDSGTSAPEHAVRKTRLGGDEVSVFNDDGQMIGALDWAIDSGNTTDLLGYLSWLHSQDTFGDWVVCYCEDAEATGLWDYEGGGDPQEDWDNLDDVLTAMESTGWIRLTTMSEYLDGRYPTEDLSPIADGQANWMVGPSQGAGYADWFDFNARAPYLNQYRRFYTTLRDRIRGVQALAAPGSPAAALLRHAVWTLVAHQFEFGCIGCGWWGCQDYQKAETLEGAVLAAEAALEPPTRTVIENVDANGDGALDWTLTTPSEFYVVSPTGGRLLRWFDLADGDEILGNEIFMWGYYYLGWREWYGGQGTNDDRHYQTDYVWDAWNHAPAADPFHRVYPIRKHAMNDFLSIDGGDDEIVLNAEYAAALDGDTLVFSLASRGLQMTKSYIARDTTLSIVYTLRNATSSTHHYNLLIENGLNPSLIDIMNNGRGSVAYWDGSEAMTSITQSSTGVANIATGRAVSFSFSEPPAALEGGEIVHGLLYSPRFEFDLAPAASKSITLEVGVATSSVEPPVPPGPFRLGQNRPNPFNPLTTIDFELPAPGNVDLSVYNADGRRVATILRERCRGGPRSVTWDGTDDEGRLLASGVYFFRMNYAGRSATRKGVLLR